MQASRAIGLTDVTLVARNAAFDGRGSRSDLDGIAFTGTDRRWVIEADMRRRFGSWAAAATMGVSQTRRR